MRCISQIFIKPEHAWYNMNSLVCSLYPCLRFSRENKSFYPISLTFFFLISHVNIENAFYKIIKQQTFRGIYRVIHLNAEQNNAIEKGQRTNRIYAHALHLPIFEQKRNYQKCELVRVYSENIENYSNRCWLIWLQHSFHMCMVCGFASVFQRILCSKWLRLFVNALMTFSIEGSI